MLSGNKEFPWTVKPEETLPSGFLVRQQGIYLGNPQRADWRIGRRLGKDVFIGPNVSILTSMHPLRWQERNAYHREDGVLTDKEYVGV
jgi:hypothetical protein